MKWNLNFANFEFDEFMLLSVEDRERVRAGLQPTPQYDDRVAFNVAAHNLRRLAAACYFECAEFILLRPSVELRAKHNVEGFQCEHFERIALERDAYFLFCFLIAANSVDAQSSIVQSDVDRGRIAATVGTHLEELCWQLDFWRS